MAAATTGAARLTPLASLFDTVIRKAEGVNLATWLAMNRAPGTDWKTYDQLAAHMTKATQAQQVAYRPVNRVTMKTFTEITFGIPDTRYVEVNGRNTAMPRPASADAIAAYVNALTSPAIDTTRVADYAGAALGRHLKAQVDAQDAADN